MKNFAYQGAELDLFAGAKNWKSYWSREIEPFLKGDVLEVGAGIGSNIRYLDRPGLGQWVCLEPDAALARKLGARLAQSSRMPPIEIMCGTLETVTGRQFDTILYIDVLEHIERDGEELATAARCLRPGGHLVVLSPAYHWLFSRFDDALGHFRRYGSRALRRLTPPGLRLERLWHLDSAGLIASIGGLWLRQQMPSRTQISIWDRGLVPLSRVTDRMLAHCVGRSVVAVWEKPQGTDRGAD
jgi:SAM-dependent methyltransferase